MKTSELNNLRRLVNAEVYRREKIRELLENESVKEYLKIANINIEDLDANDFLAIISEVLSSFSITETNGIYVCTNAWRAECTVCYEEITFYNQKVDINSKEAEYKTYIDIESGECIRASKMRNNVEEDLISTFESEKVVLNPHNTSKNSNGYDEVRLDFFETAIKDSQAKARKLVLSKYPKI